MNPIQKDLQELVDAKVISQETAAGIERYYANRSQPASNRFTIVLSILGALLVGLGVVLVIAHNWDELGILPKTVFAFLPMLLGQALCLYTLLKQKENTAWRESSAVLLFFGVGSCISLISQIYHMGGELSAFLLTWMLLTVPLMYIMPSYITGLLYIAGISWYACLLGYFNRSGLQPFLFLPLLLLAAPAWIQLFRHKRDGNLFVLYNWFLAASITLVLGTFIPGNEDSARGFLCYLTLFALYYVAGTSPVFRGQRLFANPYLLIAVPALAGILLFWTYSYPWMIWNDEENHPSVFLYLLLAAMAGLLAATIRRYKKQGWQGISPVEFSPFVFLVAILITNRNIPAASYDSYVAMPGVFIINLWVLVLGIYFTRRGSIQQHFGILNLGLLIIASLALLRFFDDRIPFVWRGIFFLATGIGFFAANYLLIKKKRSLALKQTA